MKKQWKIEVEDWTEINIDAALFIFTEADKFLKHTIENRDRTSKRGSTFLLIMLSIATAIAGYTFNEFSKNQEFSSTVIINALYLICILPVIYSLVRLISPGVYYFNGREPKEIAIPAYLSNRLLPQKYAYLALVNCEISACQARIEYNLAQNRDRLYKLGKAIKYMVVTAIMYIAITVINIILLQ